MHTFGFRAASTFNGMKNLVSGFGALTISLVGLLVGLLVSEAAQA